MCTLSADVDHEDVYMAQCMCHITLEGAFSMNFQRRRKRKERQDKKIRKAGTYLLYIFKCDSLTSFTSQRSLQTLLFINILHSLVLLFSFKCAMTNSGREDEHCVQCKCGVQTAVLIKETLWDGECWIFLRFHCSITVFSSPDSSLKKKRQMNAALIYRSYFPQIINPTHFPLGVIVFTHHVVMYDLHCCGELTGLVLSKDALSALLGPHLEHLFLSIRPQRKTP